MLFASVFKNRPKVPAEKEPVQLLAPTSDVVCVLF